MKKMLANVNAIALKEYALVNAVIFILTNVNVVVTILIANVNVEKILLHF